MQRSFSDFVTFAIMRTEQPARFAGGEAVTREARAGLVLMGATILALAMANSPFAPGWHALFREPWMGHALPLLPGELTTVKGWIDDGLMTVFFFTVGLEIKRELVIGDLAHRATRALPIVAAAAGMLAPALIYLAVARASGVAGLSAGWAIPCATDIAFAMGVTGLLGARVPRALRLFLLTVAVVDDLGAVAIIAVAYSGPLAPLWMAAAAAVLLAMIALNLGKCHSAWPYAGLAVALWFCVLHSGVHATIAGVLAAMCVPLRLSGRPDSLALRMEHALAPLSGFAIVPLFALANAGVALPASGWSGLLRPLPLAVAGGLVLGKQAGIFGAVWLADRTGLAPRPSGAGWGQIWGICLLAGIGFTMSLFLTPLAFPAAPGLAEQARLGVLAGSLVSAGLGFWVLRSGKAQVANPAR